MSIEVISGYQDTTDARFHNWACHWAFGKSPAQRAKNLGSALRSLEYDRINMHSNVFNVLMGMKQVIPLEKSEDMIRKWLEDNKDSDLPDNEFGTKFVNDILFYVLD